MESQGMRILIVLIHQIHLVTTTDSEVLYRLVSRRVGPGVKDSLGEPLNKRADNLVDEGRSLTKNGKDYQWKDRTTHLVYYSSFDMTSNQWGGKSKITWSKNDSQYSEEGENDSQRREKDL